MFTHIDIKKYINKNSAVALEIHVSPFTPGIKLNLYYEVAICPLLQMHDPLYWHSLPIRSAVSKLIVGISFTSSVAHIVYLQWSKIYKLHAVAFIVIPWKSINKNILWLLFATSLKLTHSGRVTRVCLSNLTIISSDNSFSLCRRRAITQLSQPMMVYCQLDTKEEMSIKC